MSGSLLPAQVATGAASAAQAGRLRAALPGEGPGLVWEHEAPVFQMIAPLAGQAWTPTAPPPGLPAWFDSPLPTGLVAVLGVEPTPFIQPADLAQPWPALERPAADPSPAGDNPAAPPRAGDLPAPLFPAPVLEGGARLLRLIPEETEGVAHRPTVTDRPAEGLGWRITGGADAALLFMDPASGALSFRTAPDFERPADADGDNAYEVVFEVRDGWGAAAAQRLTLLVTDQPEAPPPPLGADPLWG